MHRGPGGPARGVGRRTGLLPLCLLLPVLVVALPSCGKKSATRPVDTSNKPPVVEALSFSPNRIHVHERVRVSARASDPENRPLGFVWEATRGSFPEGRVLSSVVWSTPVNPGADTVRVTVSDGIDEVVASRPVSYVTVGPPTSVGVTVGAVNADLRWGASLDEGMSDWQGYEIYQANRSFTEIPPESLAAHRVGLETDRSARVTGLTQGTRYYFRIVSLRSWPGREERSGLSGEISLSPRPDGVQFLRELAGSSTGVALDLSEHGLARTLTTADTAGMSLRDLYLGTTDPFDAFGPPADPYPLVLKGVSRLANRHPGWAARQVRIKQIGTSWSISTTTDEGWSEEVPVVEGAVYALKLPEGNWAKLQITGIAPGAVREIYVRWAYQTIADYANF